MVIYSNAYFLVHIFFIPGHTNNWYIYILSINSSLFCIRSSYFLFVSFFHISTSPKTHRAVQLFEQDIGPLKRSLSVKTRRFSRISDLALVTKTKWCPLNVLWATKCFTTAFCCPCSREVSCFHTTHYTIELPLIFFVFKQYLFSSVCLCFVLFAYTFFVTCGCFVFDRKCAILLLSYICVYNTVIGIKFTGCFYEALSFCPFTAIKSGF